MPTDIERLAVLIEANTKSYERAMEKLQANTDRALRNVEKRFADSSKLLDSVFGGIGNKFKAALSVAGAIRGVQEVVSAFKDLAKVGDVAERIGTTTDVLQALRFVVSQNGGELSDADAAMQKFADSLGEAAVGTTYLTKLFNANNVSLKDAHGNLRNIDDMLVQFAGLVAGAGTAQEKMMLVTEAFGRKAGPAMLLSLDEIAKKGLPGLTASAKDAGAVVDKELIAKAREFDDAWDKATLSASNSVKSWIVQALDGLKSFDKKLDEVKRKGGLIGLAVEAVKNQIPPDQRPPSPPAPVTVNLPMPPPRPASADAKTVVPQKGGDDSFQKALDQARKRIEVVDAETRTIGLNSEARARAKLVTELEAAAKEANSAAGMRNTAVTSQQQAAIEVLADKMLLAEKRSREMETAFKAVNQTTEFLGNTAATAFEQFLDGADFATTALKALRSELIKAAFTGQGAFANILGMASSVTGQTGGLFGLLGGLFGGARAAGGQVAPGKAYLVNEQTARSEIFVPKVAGRIETSGSGGRLGGSSKSVTYAPSYHFAAGVGPADRSMIQAMIGESERRTRADVTSIVRGDLSRDRDALGI